MLIVSMGARHSTVFNKSVTAINLAVVIFVVGVGLWHVDTKNWTPRENFAPHGASGILAGAASCFFCFVGFDVIATAGEETVNPRRNIPLSIVLSLLISFFCYFGVATVLTMMVSYKDLSEQAPLANAFGEHAFKVQGVFKNPPISYNYQPVHSLYYAVLQYRVIQAVHRLISYILHCLYSILAIGMYWK